MLLYAEKVHGKTYTAIKARSADMARKIVITSGKGGVGKTTIAANLSAQLARKGYRVILWIGVKGCDPLRRV